MRPSILWCWLGYLLGYLPGTPRMRAAMLDTIRAGVWDLKLDDIPLDITWEQLIEAGTRSTRFLPRPFRDVMRQEMEKRADQDERLALLRGE
jgi:hypothetical protein